MAKQMINLHWFGFREFNRKRKYHTTHDDKEGIPEHLSPNLAITERHDMKEYFCKLCGYGFPYASLHAIRMHAIETHNHDGSLRLG